MKVPIIISALIMIGGCATTITKNNIITIKDCDTHNKVFINVEEESQKFTDLSSTKTSYHYINSISNLEITQTTSYISEVICDEEFLNLDKLPEGKCEIKTQNITEGLIFTVKDGKYKLKFNTILSMNKGDNGISKPITREFITKGIIPEKSSSIKDASKYGSHHGLTVFKSNLIFCKP
jgi:hypothetical protein